jgi:S-DNA-T family DNA segregation ATPase FtsK/SpoIIIE
MGASRPIRLQCVFVSEMEIRDIVAHCRMQTEPTYREGSQPEHSREIDSDMGE